MTLDKTKYWNKRKSYKSLSPDVKKYLINKHIFFTFLSLEYSSVFKITVVILIESIFDQISWKFCEKIRVESLVKNLWSFIMQVKIKIKSSILYVEFSIIDIALEKLLFARKEYFEMFFLISLKVFTQNNFCRSCIVKPVTRKLKF